MSKIKTFGEIRLLGDPTLREPAKKVTIFDNRVEDVIDKMINMMIDNNGIGLSSNQTTIDFDTIFGYVPSIFVMGVKDAPRVIINPKIVDYSGSSLIEEGCLSLPNIVLPLKRPQKITVEYNNSNGDLCHTKFDSLAARVILHEYDHLNGRLIIDYSDFFNMGRRMMKRDVNGDIYKKSKLLVGL